MIVPTMTPEEIYAEMYKDAEWLQERVNNILTPNYCKLAKRAKNYPYIKSYCEISPKTQIVYDIFYWSYVRSDWNRPQYIIYTTYSHEGGKTLVYIEKKGFSIRIYTPHFMSRYRERDEERMSQCDGGLNIDLCFIIKNYDVQEMRFFKNISENMRDNPYIMQLLGQQQLSRFWQDPDYERYSAACLRGVCLCERHKKNPHISIFDTFISYDLLKDSQRIEYAMAYVHVFLRAVEKKYPRQFQFIAKEWNDFVDNMNKSDGNPLEMLIDKLIELEERYPLNIVM